MSEPAIGHFDLREMVCGGLKPLSETAGPVVYAKRLARYIRDASTIRARTINEYGRAPSIDEIKAMQAKARAERALVLHVAQRDAPDAGEDPKFWGTPGLIRLAAERRAVADRVAARRALARLTEAAGDGTDQNPPRDMVTAREVITMTARAFGLTYADVTGQSRVRTITAVRHMVAWILLQRGRLSRAQIGRILGGRDHTTVINAVRRFEGKATPEQRAAALAIVNWRNPLIESADSEVAEPDADTSATAMSLPPLPSLEPRVGGDCTDHVADAGNMPR